MVLFGTDALLSDPSLIPHPRLGLVTNDAARPAASPDVPSRLALQRAGLPRTRLFSPEHGIAAAAPDGDHVPDTTDPLTRLPVTSLYGQTQRPTPDMFADLGAVLFDIPDIGSRFYTYIWTLSHVLEVCAETRTPLYVLDRPNPLSGDLNSAEGPLLDESFASTFVGRWNIPVRHALTAGELARLWNAERNIHADLHVIPCPGWTRGMHWPDTRLPFIPPSPNMPTYESALVYPGTCLFEGTTLSEGRTTPYPFRLIGAPWLNATDVAAALDSLSLPGVRIEPHDFTPTGRKFANEPCRGLLFTPTDPHSFRPVATTLHTLAAIAQLHPTQLDWLPYPTAANPTGGHHFQRLIGHPDILTTLHTTPHRAPSLIPQWTSIDDWTTRVTPHLLYS
jgi:uncharacterized protein YbbC (DUF1343 family)